jgi:hypothetical protein
MEHCRQDGKLERIFSQTPGEDPVTHQDLRYTYDKNGNITQILDYVSADPQTGDPLTQDFEYDALDRLTSAGAANGTQGNYSESYTYDATTGNLAIKGSSSYNYGPQSANCPQGALDKAHTVVTAGTKTFCYDQNGNMVRRTIDSVPYTLTYTDVMGSQGDKQNWMQGRQFCQSPLFKESF